MTGPRGSVELCWLAKQEVLGLIPTVTNIFHEKG